MDETIKELLHRLRQSWFAINAGQRSPSAGVILSGDPGCGKTLLTKTLAANIGLFYRIVHTPNLFHAEEGRSEQALEKYFRSSDGNLSQSHQMILLVLEDIDVICSTELGVHAQVEKRLFALLLTLLDATPNVFVIGTTSLANVISPQVTRSGRLDATFELSIRTEAQRRQVFNIMLRDLLPYNQDSQLAITTLAARTKGYTAADLKSLCVRAFTRAVNRASGDSSEVGISMNDFVQELALMRPSVLGEFQSQIPRVTFAELYGLEDKISELKASMANHIYVHSTVLQSFRDRDQFIKLGMRPPHGVLIHGPSGVGKSVLCCALANELDMNVILAESSQLRSMIVGESEKAVAKLFARARQSAPCVIIFDQIDVLAAKRGSSTSSENTNDRIVTTLLTEMDGFQTKRGIHGSSGDGGDTVVVIAVTNRPSVLDPAIVRPGRLDVHIEIGLPGNQQRREIIEMQLRKMPVDYSNDGDLIGALTTRTSGWSSAQIINMCKEAAMIALRESISATKVLPAHFYQALAMV